MRRFMGMEIKDVSRHESKVEGFRYFVQTRHHSGMNWSEENCPRFRSLAAARDWIREEIAQVGAEEKK